MEALNEIYEGKKVRIFDIAGINVITFLKTPI